METKAPKNYIKDSTPIPFEILEHGKTLKVIKENEGEEGTAAFRKTSEDGVVKDVALHIYGKSNTGIEVDETVVTDENGSVSLSLLTGTYTVEEIKVAGRYVTPAKQTIKIEADKTSAVTFNNILKHGKVTTTKVDEEYPDNKLNGAVFEVYDSEGNAVDEETIKDLYTKKYDISKPETLSEIPKEKTITIDGKDHTLQLEDIKYKSVPIIHRTADVSTTVKLTEDEIKDSIVYRYADEDTGRNVNVILHKSSVSETDEVKENSISFPVTFHRYGSEEYVINSKRIPISEENSPQAETVRYRFS